MKDFVLYHSSETPQEINKENFEKLTKNEYPFRQNFNGANHYYATCPECENPIQLKGLYTDGKTYGAHTGKNISGLNAFNYENYIYCPRSVKGSHVPKDERKTITSPKDRTVYNTLKNNFDLVISYAKKYLGFYITDEKAMECLKTYVASQGWLYPHSTVNNLPFVLFYLQPAINPYNLLVRKESKLEGAILKSNDLKLENLTGGRLKNLPQYYRKLVPNSNKYVILTMMIWNHKFKEDINGSLHESVDIQICKDISNDPDRHDWKELVNLTIQIPELSFINYINNASYRKQKLINCANKIMPII